jgi:hypothetical protein
MSTNPQPQISIKPEIADQFRRLYWPDEPDWQKVMRIGRAGQLQVDGAGVLRLRGDRLTRERFDRAE